jgi:hypothetical protein
MMATLNRCFKACAVVSFVLFGVFSFCKAEPFRDALPSARFNALKESLAPGMKKEVQVFIKGLAERSSKGHIQP